MYDFPTDYLASEFWMWDWIYRRRCILWTFTDYTIKLFWLFFDKCSKLTVCPIQFGVVGLRSQFYTGYSRWLFLGCQRLRILRCESCKLSSCPNLRPISQTTESLMLGQNNISSISSLYEVPFRALKYIYLAHNSINHIEVNRLILPMLAEINLQWNLIMSLDDVSHSGWGLLNTGVLRGDSSSLNQKVALYLEGNPWHCDNRLIWMSIAVRQNNRENMTFTIADGLDVTCASPPSLHGRSISSTGK